MVINTFSLMNYQKQLNHLMLIMDTSLMDYSLITKHKSFTCSMVLSIEKLLQQEDKETESATFLEQGWVKFHRNRKHIHFSAGHPPPQVTSRAEEEKRPIILSVGKSDGKIIHANQHSAQAKGWGEFNLQGSRREICLPTMELCDPPPEPLIQIPL